MDGTNFKKASFLERLLAYVIDYIIISTVTFVLIFLLSILLLFLKVNPTFLFILSILIALSITVSYTTLFIWKSGSTLGKRLLKLKVVSSSYQQVGFTKALLRETLAKYLSGILNLGYLWVLIDRNRQSWHDKIAKTYVVKTDSAGEMIPVSEEEKISTGQKIAFGLAIVFSILNVIVLTLALIFAFILEPIKISGSAMLPQYVDGQSYLVDKITYISSDPSRGDVVLLENPKDPSKKIVRRIVGLPNEKVTLQNGEIYIDDRPLSESGYLATGKKTLGGAFLQTGQSVTVPDDSYFVLSDNRDYGSDSQEWGSIPKQNIIGKISVCYDNCELSGK